MVDVLPLLAAVGVIVLWCLGLYGLQRRGLLEPHGLQPSPPPAGPFLMWKTLPGRQLIHRLPRPKRFWRGFGGPPTLPLAPTVAGPPGLPPVGGGPRPKHAPPTHPPPPSA